MKESWCVRVCVCIESMHACVRVTSNHIYMFHPIVFSFQCRMYVDTVHVHVVHCTLHASSQAISTINFSLQMRRNQIRKGMVMLATSERPMACWEFEGDILVLHHPTTISTKYQAMGESSNILGTENPVLCSLTLSLGLPVYQVCFVYLDSDSAS